MGFLSGQGCGRYATGPHSCARLLPRGRGCTQGAEPWLHVVILRGALNNPDTRIIKIKLRRGCLCIRDFSSSWSDPNKQPRLRTRELECPSNFNVHTNCLGSWQNADLRSAGLGLGAQDSAFLANITLC